MPASLADWIARETIRFSVDSAGAVSAAIHGVIASLGDSVELLGFGEALHSGSDILALRNRLFERLAEAHGYSAIAVESSFPRARVVNEHVAGRGPESYEAIQDSGFSHGFGRLEANRELVEWMRRYNSDPDCGVKLRFYGFDSPTEMMGADSPRELLHRILDYLATVDSAAGRAWRVRIEPLLGDETAWQSFEAMMDPTKSIGRSPAATKLRIEMEDLTARLRVRRPELATGDGEDSYLDALHCASMARQLLSYHAAMATASSDRTAFLLGLRDAMMADNLAYIVARERGRGKVLAFAHNSHLQRGAARWQLGPDLLEWWPAGSHLGQMLGPRYVVIGSAVGVSDANGIGQPEDGTLEALLTATPGAARFIPTHRGQGFPEEDVAALLTRSGSTRNSSYFPLSSRSLGDFDWLAVLDSTGYDPGGPPLVG